MSARRSRDAAATRADDGANTPSPLSRAQVETCARVFDELTRLPRYQEDERRARAIALAAFIERVRAGDIAPDARALAALVAQRGAAWLLEHPALAPITTDTWDLALVEAAVLRFNERTARPPSAQVAEKLVDELHTFERVLAAGAVAPGAATDLAHAFVVYAHRWLITHPGVLARYQTRL